MDQALIQYYLKELAQIEDDCAEFAGMHPQVAGRLTLNGEGATDPQVRQLIESVAFISSRLKRHMDGLSGEIVYALLQVLCPQLTRPIPAMAVVKFSPARSDQDVVPTEIAAGGLLQGVSSQNERCTLSLPSAATLWPLQAQVFWAGKKEDHPAQSPGKGDENCLVIRLSSGGKKIKPHSIQSLNFFISGPLNRAMAAAEAFALGVLTIRIAATDGSWQTSLPASALKIIGFGGPGERLLPTHSIAEDLGNMVREYLLFPQRFCFFRIDGLVLPQPSQAFDIALTLDSRAVLPIDAAKNHIAVNCLPVVNLYSRQSVPIGLLAHHRQSEFLIPSDPSRPGNWDVYSINRVRVLGKGGEVTLPEYFSASIQSGAHPVYWVESRRERIGGTTSYASAVLGFVDEERCASDNAWAGGDVAVVDLSCTNGRVPELLACGQALDTSSVSPHYKATVEMTASRYIEPTLPQATKMGRLLAAFSFRNGVPNAHAAMADMVRNYLRAHGHGTSAFAQAQINGLRQIDRSLVAMPLPIFDGAHELGAGFRYDVRFHDNRQMDGGRYFFGKIVKALMEQMCDVSIPQEVWVHDPIWGPTRIE